jgi:hypothetical protein
MDRQHDVLSAPTWYCNLLPGITMKAAKPRPTTPEEEGIELYPDAMERLEQAVKTAARHGHIPAEAIRKTTRKLRYSSSIKPKRS